MGDIQNRPFSKDYSGLIDQSVIAIGITLVCVASYEVMKRRRRGPHPPEGLGSVESWQFGYLYQGRSWARKPSPPISQGRPLSWVKEVVRMPQAKFNELRGVDATLYVRFLQGCLYFVLLHTFTTVPILLPIHVHFSPDDVSPKSMTRASISSLVLTQAGLELLWIHVCLLFWLTLTWIATLLYICNGAFKFRAAKIDEAARMAEPGVLAAERDARYYPHPYPQFPFQDTPLDADRSNRGLRLRTIMVSNIPSELRTEEDLKEYFESYMSRTIDIPSSGLTSSTQPGSVDKLVAFIFNRAKRISQCIPIPQAIGLRSQAKMEEPPNNATTGEIPAVERVVIARKMTELASLLERREDILCALEEAHIKLAKKTLAAVTRELHKRRISMESTYSSSGKQVVDVESQQCPGSSKADMDLLVRTLEPFIARVSVSEKKINRPKNFLWRRRKVPSEGSENNLVTLVDIPNELTPDIHGNRFETVWDALLSLPRKMLDPYQPLIHLSVLFRGKTVPSIDYYTAKLKLLTVLISQDRAKPINEYNPVSTAFVTFKDPKDARKACKYLAVHPDNPLTCLVTMAPQYEDIDWTRVMKSTFRAELIKDWVVNLGVWGFTIFWLFPVSLFVGLVSIESISTFWPSLYDYLSRHPWQQEIIQSFLPTVLVSLLAILIPLILLLIARKAYRITTLSLIHDTIMIRYYKFLIVNVLVFFCVGVAVLQTFLTSFGKVSESNILGVVADSFPSAGPFYVGWFIFAIAVHGSLELVMFGLPLFAYPSTSRQTAPRKRAVAIRPRSFDFFYWLPNHLLIIHICLLFAILNPLVIPFALIYFAVETVVVKNQLLHLYAKNYECNGQILLIRIVRYSLDGLMFSQFVFLAYMAVLKKTVNLALAAVLFILTAIVKIILTRVCRARFEQDDVLEAEVICGTGGTTEAEHLEGDPTNFQVNLPTNNEDANDAESRIPSRFSTLSRWMSFSYIKDPRYMHSPRRRQPIPFHSREGSFPSVDSVEENGEETPSAALCSVTLQRHHADTSSTTSLISRRPPHPTWDDEPRHDIPYDNPYYARPISSALWLPRRIYGPLDLDDTVDLRQSLTSEPSEEVFDLETAYSASLTPIFESPTSPDVERGSNFPAMPKQYSGEEDIDLPEGIRNRVMANNEEIHSADECRPSLFRQRFSSSSTNGKNSALRVPRGRSYTIDERPRTQSQMFESSGEPPRQRAMSMLPPAGHQDSPTQVYATSDPASRPDLHAQAELIRSTASVVARGSRVSVGNVTTGEAVLNEAIAEEQLAAEARLKKEEAEAVQDNKRLAPAWLASWFYAKVTTKSR
ncbi:hypothetical protein J3A83DRAFT_4204650 [Scleroderma citrinum]